MSSRRRATTDTKLSKKSSRNHTDFHSKDGFEMLKSETLPLLIDSSTSKCSEVFVRQIYQLSKHLNCVLLSGWHTWWTWFKFTARPRHWHSIDFNQKTGTDCGLLFGICSFHSFSFDFGLSKSKSDKGVKQVLKGVLQVKKQRRALKRDQPTAPPDYMSYRHFSIQSGEHADRSGHPQFITDISNKTSLN